MSKDKKTSKKKDPKKKDQETKEKKQVQWSNQVDVVNASARKWNDLKG